jgi:uncharacterized protein (TIGR00661 family)
MPSILLAVHGDSVSSAFYAQEIIAALPKHKVHVVATAVPHRFLKGSVLRLHRIRGFDAVFGARDVNVNRTLAHLLEQYSRLERTEGPRIDKLIGRVKPEVVVSIDESISAHIANRRGVPVLQVSALSILTKGHFKVPLNKFAAYWESRVVAEFFSERVDKWLVPALTKVRLSGSRVNRLPPILRAQAHSIKPAYGEYLLVYQPRSLSAAHLKVMRQSGKQFVVYGSKGRSSSTIRFRPFSEERFLKDLAGCKCTTL